MTFFRLPLLSALAVIALAPARADSNGAQQVIRKWEAAFNKGDYAGVANLYTEDAILMPLGAPTIKGRAGVENYFKQIVQVLGDVKITSSTVSPANADLAIEIGTFTGQVKGSSPQPISGKYMETLTKVGDTWKISADIWNSDKE